MKRIHDGTAKCIESGGFGLKENRQNQNIPKRQEGQRLALTYRTRTVKVSSGIGSYYRRSCYVTGTAQNPLHEKTSHLLSPELVCTELCKHTALLCREVYTEILHQCLQHLSSMKLTVIQQLKTLKAPLLQWMAKQSFRKLKWWLWKPPRTWGSSDWEKDTKGFGKQSWAWNTTKSLWCSPLPGYIPSYCAFPPYSPPRKPAISTFSSNLLDTFYLFFMDRTPAVLCHVPAELNC